MHICRKIPTALHKARPRAVSPLAVATPVCKKKAGCVLLWRMCICWKNKGVFRRSTALGSLCIYIYTSVILGSAFTVLTALRTAWSFYSRGSEMLVACAAFALCLWLGWCGQAIACATRKNESGNALASVCVCMYECTCAYMPWKLETT